MLAYHVEWHLRQKWKPMFFDDEDLAEVHALSASPVAPAERSEPAKRKDMTRRTADGLPVRSLRTLLKGLATLTLNVAKPSLNPKAKILLTTRPTSVQDKALRLLVRAAPKLVRI